MGYEIAFAYQGANAVITVWDDEKTAVLETIESEFRRHGSAQTIMRRVVAYADAFDLVLLLKVTPFGDEPKMTAPELKAFYMSHGFISQGSNIMARHPVKE